MPTWEVEALARDHDEPRQARRFARAELVRRYFLDTTELEIRDAETKGE